jgi:hypothetical protein
MDDDRIWVRIWCNCIENESISCNSWEVTIGLGSNQERGEIRFETDDGQGEEYCLSILFC